MAFQSLHKLYQESVVEQLKQQCSTKFPPKLSKIVLNMGLGKAVTDKNLLEDAMNIMGAISGQKPQRTNVLTSNAGFGIRAGWPIGCKVTLRRSRMYDFLERLLYIAIPRIPDFQGLSVKSFDGRGNYTLGINDHSIFPECDIIQKRMGLDVTIVTTAESNKVGYTLLSLMGFPFKTNKEY